MKPSTEMRTVHYGKTQPTLDISLTLSRRAAQIRSSSVERSGLSSEEMNWKIFP